MFNFQKLFFFITLLGISSFLAESQINAQIERYKYDYATGGLKHECECRGNCSKGPYRCCYHGYGCPNCDYYYYYYNQFDLNHYPYYYDIPSPFNYQNE